MGSYPIDELGFLQPKWHFHALRVYQSMLIIAVRTATGLPDLNGLYQYSLDGKFVKTICSDSVEDFLVVHDRIFAITDSMLYMLTLHGQELCRFILPTTEPATEIAFKLAVRGSSLLVLAKRLKWLDGSMME